MEHAVPFPADTSLPFKQLLAAEQTAQSIQAWIQEKKDAMRTIKQQALDQERPGDDYYNTIMSLAEMIRRFKKLLKSNEAHRNRWRRLHTAAWRATVRPLKVVDLPNETLATIIANFEDVPVPEIQVDGAPPDDTSLPSPDVASIKNIRLTCRSFCDVGSSFLLPIVDISFTTSSIHRLEEISNHPTIPKGVRIIRIYTGTYRSVLANDLERFRAEAFSRLEISKMCFGFEQTRVAGEVREACRMAGIPLKPKFLKISGLQTALEESQDIRNALTQHQSQTGHPVVTRDRFQVKINRAIAQAHEEYRRKYVEQQKLIEDCHVHANILAAFSRMSSIQRVCLTDSPVRLWNDDFRSGWDQRLDAQKYKDIMRSPNPFRKVLVDVADRTILPQARDGDPDLILVYKLPLIFKVGDGNLTSLDISITSFDECHAEALERHLQSIQRACQQLRYVEIVIIQCRRLFRGEDIKPAFVAKTGQLLNAMLVSPRLESIKLKLTLGSDYHAVHSAAGLGAALANLPWPTLRRVRLYQWPVKIGELRQALEKVPGKLHLELSGMYLLEGTWAEALDIMRGKVDSSSFVRNPRGDEFTNMSRKEGKYLRHEFSSEHRDGWYSAQRCPGPASFYIRGGNIPNPLM